MGDKTNGWDKQKFLDAAIQAMYGTNLTFDEYYRQNPSFRNTIDRVSAAVQQARESKSTDKVNILANALRRIANEIATQELRDHDQPDNQAEGGA